MDYNFFESEEFADALRSYEQWMETGEPFYLDCDQLMDIAEYYHYHGYSDLALRAAEKAHQLFEEAVPPLVFKARILLLVENKPEEAMAVAEQIEDKLDLDYFYIKAEIMIACDQAEKADQFLEECEHLVSEDDYPDFLLDTAILFVDYELVKLARKWLALSEETSNPDYRETLGRILHFEGNYTESERIFNELLNDDPYNVYYWNMLAFSQIADHRYNDAITSSEYAIAINPHDEDALLYKAQALMQLQNYEEACTYFRRNARLRKLNVDGHLNAGLCLLQLKKDEEALKELATAERHARRSHSDKLPEVLREEVFAYSHHGDMAKAFKCVEQMEKAGCDVDEATVLRGHIHLENGQVDEARQCYIEAIEHSKYGGLVMLQAAVSLYDNDYLDSAYNILSQISSEDLERYPSTYVYLAICAHDLGKRSDYIKYLQEAVGKAPHVARLLLAPFFPEGMEPSDYYQYALNDLEMS